MRLRRSLKEVRHQPGGGAVEYKEGEGSPGGQRTKQTTNNKQQSSIIKQQKKPKPTPPHPNQPTTPPARWDEIHDTRVGPAILRMHGKQAHTLIQTLAKM